MGLYIGNKLISPAEIVNSGGSATLITKSITQNGTYNASSDSADGYSSVTVNVSGGGGDSRLGLTFNNFLGTVTSGTLSTPSSVSSLNFSGITTIESYALVSAFYLKPNFSVSLISFPNLTTINTGGLNTTFSNQSSITSISFPNLVTIGESGMASSFSRCQISSVSFPELTTINSHGMDGAFAFNQDTEMFLPTLSSASFPNLVTIGESGMNSTFDNDGISGSISFPELTTINQYGMAYAFNSNAITSVNFPKLSYVGYNALNYTFANNLDPDTGMQSITSINFPALTSNSFEYDDMMEEYSDPFDSMISSADSVTVHFPSNLQNIINTFSSASQGFGGNNTTILFDLPSTEI